MGEGAGLGQFESAVCLSLCPFPLAKQFSHLTILPQDHTTSLRELQYAGYTSLCCSLP